MPKRFLFYFLSSHSHWVRAKTTWLELFLFELHGIRSIRHFSESGPVLALTPKPERGKNFGYRWNRTHVTCVSSWAGIFFVNYAKGLSGTSGIKDLKDPGSNPTGYLVCWCLGLLTLKIDTAQR